MKTVSLNFIAKLMDLDPRRVQQLVKEGIIPKPETRGQYSIECNIRYIRHLRAARDGETGDLLTEKTRLTRAQAEKAEIEAARLKGELISIAEAERGWSALVGAFRAKVLAIPPVAAVLLENKTEKEREQILTDMEYEALAELSNWKPDDDEGADTSLASGSEGGGSAADDDDQPVG
jgi:phage terminase Nu1 subunit (DNA packaging protein)